MTMPNTLWPTSTRVAVDPDRSRLGDARLPRLTSELRFLAALWQANLLAALEYRAAFLSQVLGMMLNNGIFFVFWVLFFDRFSSVRGWALPDMLLLFGLVAAVFGLGVFLFGNVLRLAEVIANGRLDYYLSLPRPVLLHALAGRSVTSGLGDLLYGCLSFALSGPTSLAEVVRFGFGVLVSMTVFVTFLVLVHSLSFWLGNASLLAGQVLNAVICLSTYPLELFDGSARLVLFTVVPAALMGAVPAALVHRFSWVDAGALAAAAAGLLGLALAVFRRGLRRYESGSGVQVEV
jgi:ABC-2 type transport system permease protein